MVKDDVEREYKNFVRDQVAKNTNYSHEHCLKLLQLASFFKGWRAGFGQHSARDFRIVACQKKLSFVRIKFMKIIEAQRLNTISKITFSKDLTKLMNENSESATRIYCNSKQDFSRAMRRNDRILLKKMCNDRGVPFNYIHIKWLF